MGGVYDSLYMIHEPVTIPCSATVTFHVDNILTGEESTDGTEVTEVTDDLYLREDAFRARISDMVWKGSSGTIDYTMAETIDDDAFVSVRYSGCGEVINMFDINTGVNNQAFCEDSSDCHDGEVCSSSSHCM